MGESVNHPAHYGGDTTYEAIKVIDAWGLNFSLGSVLKYICRAGKKEGVSPLEDLHKALWYLHHDITERLPADDLPSNDSFAAVVRSMATFGQSMNRLSLVSKCHALLQVPTEKRDVAWHAATLEVLETIAEGDV